MQVAASRALYLDPRALGMYFSRETLPSLELGLMDLEKDIRKPALVRLETLTYTMLDFVFVDLNTLDIPRLLMSAADMPSSSSMKLVVQEERAALWTASSVREESPAE
jgi:hypothetical protein